MNIFNYSEYKPFVNDWIKDQPRHGHGQLRKISGELRVNSVVLSQIFRGERELNLEQAVMLAKYIGLNEFATNYFLLMVQLGRAGSHELKEVLRKQMRSMTQASQKLNNRIAHDEFTAADRATFYSHWYYSAIRLGASVPGLDLAERLGLERSLLNEVMEFLLRYRLLVEKDGRLELGPQVTHAAQGSPFAHRHHANWRVRALSRLEKAGENELFYTGTMTLSQESARWVRQQLVQLISQVSDHVRGSPSEDLYCLNTDWFRI